MRPLPIYCPTYQLIMCAHVCILHIDYILQKPVIYYLLSDYNFLMHILLVLQVGTLEDDPCIMLILIWYPYLLCL